MSTELHVLSMEISAHIHLASLDLLAGTGVRVDSTRGRQLFLEAGATAGETEHVLRLPVSLVESCLEQTPRQFSLGGRRPNWSLPVNARNCDLIADGGAIFTLEAESQTRRSATLADWQLATRLTDALDEIACYWGVVDGVFGHQPGDVVTHWVEILRNFSKHVQEATNTPKETRWMLEVLRIIFGSDEEIRRIHPLSFLICPASPLVLEDRFTDAYLETLGLDIPVAVMPMPLAGTTGPGTLISNLVVANSEVLAVLCLLQVAQPGTPVIYAPFPAISDPYYGRYGSGDVEHSLMGAAVTELARFYGLPVEASTGGSDHHVPSTQAGFERALNFVLPVLARPDLLVAPGLLGGSMIFSPEQFMIDMEILRRCQRLSRGISTGSEAWLDDVVAQVGPGGNFLAQRSTVEALRAGELYTYGIGWHETFERWEAQDRPDILDEARNQVEQILKDHQPLPFPPEVERELSRLQQAAKESL